MSTPHIVHVGVHGVPVWLRVLYGLLSSFSPCRYTGGECDLRSHKSTDMCVGL